MPAVAEAPAPVSVERIPPWERAGTGVEGSASAREALQRTGLNWKVEKIPMYVPAVGDVPEDPKDGAGSEWVPDRWAIRRSRDRKVLGVVGKPFVPLQNITGFQFMDDLVEQGELSYHSAGELRGGKWVYLTMKVPRGLLVGGTEAVDLYLALLNAHDGSKAITGMVTPVVIRCTNTANLAIAQAVRKWTVRHTGSLAGRIAEARRQLDLTFAYADKFESETNQLAQSSFSDAEFEQFIESLTSKENVREGLKDAWENGAHGRSNKWDALQAVGEYGDWLRDPRSANAQLMGTWFGPQLQLRDKALVALRGAS